MPVSRVGSRVKCYRKRSGPAIPVGGGTVGGRRRLRCAAPLMSLLPALAAAARVASARVASAAIAALLLLSIAFALAASETITMSNSFGNNHDVEKNLKKHERQEEENDSGQLPAPPPQKQAKAETKATPAEPKDHFVGLCDSSSKLPPSLIGQQVLRTPAPHAPDKQRCLVYRTSLVVCAQVAHAGPIIYAEDNEHTFYLDVSNARARWASASPCQSHRARRNSRSIHARDVRLLRSQGATFTKLIEDAGAKYAGSINSKTTIVVVGALDKARSLTQRPRVQHNHSALGTHCQPCTVAAGVEQEVRRPLDVEQQGACLPRAGCAREHISIRTFVAHLRRSPPCLHLQELAIKAQRAAGSARKLPFVVVSFA